MKRLVYIGLIVGHFVLVTVYYLLSGEEAGTAMLAMFGVAMWVMGWVLIPTFGDVGPTAPVDPDWHERGQDAAPER